MTIDRYDEFANDDLREVEGLHPTPDRADELQLAKDYLHDGLSYVLQGRRDLAITALADAAHRMSNDPEIRTLADRIVRANGGG